MPKEKKKLTRAEYESREDLLKDRLAICLMLLAAEPRGITLRAVAPSTKQP